VRDQQLYLQLSKLVSDSLVNLYESLLGTYADPYVTGASERMAITKHIDQTSSVITENLHLLKKKYNGLITTAMTQIEKYHDASMIYLVIMGMLLALSAFLLVLIIIRSVLRPLKQFGSILQDMGKGTLPPELLPGRQDEIGQMAQAMNNLAGRLKVLSGFAEEIGRGNYASDFQPLSENDILGNALIRMREDLKNAAVEESRRKTEDERRNWSNQGIARFSEILREHNNDIDKLNESVISNLVRYTNARVGALFLVNRPSSGNNFLELSAAYAYDRMKYLKKEIPAGEGLAGRCLQEGETIYLTDVPDDYIKIRSGMGEANPTSVLIVPLKMHEEIVGIVELASFESFEPYKIEFMERIGTSIASTIAAIRSGLKRSVSASKAGDRVSEPTDDGEQVITAGKPDETKDTSAPDRTEEIRKKLDDLLKKKQ
jgi:HAMP domain-containing protein